MKITILVLPLLGVLAACDSGPPEPDPAVLDQAFNNIIAADEAERARLVEEARLREEERTREMEARRANFVDEAAGNEAANAAANAQ